MKLSKWFWGLFFILAGGAIIVNQLGYFGTINIYTLIFTILLIPIIIKSIPHLNFSGIIFPLAIILIMYQKPLGLSEIGAWPILGAALFLTIGLTIIFPPRYHHRHYASDSRNPEHEHFDEIIDEPDEEQVGIHVSFGSSIKYVNSNNFKKGRFHCSFGALKVYFDNAKIKDQAEVILDISFAGVELYIPKEWNVSIQTNATLGGIEEKNYHTPINDSPTLILKGSVSLAGVEIIYI